MVDPAKLAKYNQLTRQLENLMSAWAGLEDWRNSAVYKQFKELEPTWIELRNEIGNAST